jgi:hypothetical protein
VPTSVQPSGKKQFLAVVAESARPFRPAWRVGASGLIRRFEWLSAEEEPRSSPELRYAALLAHHLRKDDQVDRPPARAADVRAREDRAAEKRGVDLSYRSDDQTTYPQDWSPNRFERFLRSAPRD